MDTDPACHPLSASMFELHCCEAAQSTRNGHSVIYTPLGNKSVINAVFQHQILHSNGSSNHAVYINKQLLHITQLLYVWQQCVHWRSGLWLDHFTVHVTPQLIAYSASPRWLGVRKSIRTVRKLSGYLSGVRCKWLHTVQLTPLSPG